MDEIESFVVDWFDSVYQAMCDGDIARLEAFAQESSFPSGTDGWLGRHWLTLAIASQNPDALAWVLSKSPEVNYVDDEGFTPLKSALQVEIDCKLVHGLNDQDAAKLTIRTLDMLLDAGTDIAQTGTLDETVLHTAAMWSSVDVVRHLLLRGADPLAWDAEYIPRQPPYYAKYNKHPQVRALLEAAAAQAQG